MMPDRTLGEKPYELAARELFYKVLEWRYGDDWTEPHAHLAEECKLGRLLVDHFKRFDEYRQDALERLLELNREQTDLMLPRPGPSPQPSGPSPQPLLLKTQPPPR